MSLVVDAESLASSIRAYRTRLHAGRNRRYNRKHKKKAKYTRPARSGPSQAAGERLLARKKAELLEKKRNDMKVARDLLKELDCDQYAMRLDMTEVELLAVLERDGVNVDEVFNDSERNLAKALFLYYVNSGYLSFDNQREYMNCYAGQLVDKERIISQVEEEKLTDNERDVLIGRFYDRHSYTDAKLYACAACGHRVREQRTKPEVVYKYVDVESDFMSVLRYNDDQEYSFRSDRIAQELTPLQVPINAEFDVGPLFPWKAKSVFELGDGECGSNLFHLHPELVDCVDGDRSFVRLCTYCYESLEKKQIPKLSVAGGVDFGNYTRVGLEKPSLHEEMIIAKTRLVISSLKIKSNMCGRVSLDRDSLQCNAVLFCQDNVDSIGRMLSGEEMFDEAGLVALLKVFLLDDKGNIDRLSRAAFGRVDLLARPWVVCQWILFLHAVHVSYIDEVFPSVEEIRAKIERSNNEIKKNAVKIDVKEFVDFENQLGSDVANTQYEEVGDISGIEEEDDNTDDHTPLRVSCVIPNADRAMESDGVREFAFLSAMQRLLEPNGQFTSSGKTPCRKSSDSCSDESEDQSQTESSDIGEYEADDNEFDEEEGNLSSSLDVEKDETPPGGIPLGGFQSMFGDRFRPVPVEENVNETGITRDIDPINEFIEKENVVVAAFPTVFLFGSAYGVPFGKLNTRQRDHLFHQYTRIPSTNRRLLLYLFDALMRFRAITGVNAHVQHSRSAISAIRNLSENKEERVRLAQAKKYPKSEHAKKFLQRYTPHLQFSGLNTAYGCFEGKKLKAMLVESCKRYRPPSAFLTFNFDDINNPRAIRASFATVNNRSFPAVFEQDCPYGVDGYDFISKMRKSGNEVGSGVVDLSPEYRASLAKDDPITFVSETRELLVHVCEIMLGVNLEEMFSKTLATTLRKTVYYKSRKGILGYPMSILGVIEDHAKGTVHFHVLFFGGVSPYVMQRFAGMEEICQAISATLDTMYCSSISSEYHTVPVVRRIIGQRKQNKIRLPEFSSEVLLGRPDCSSVVSSGLVDYDKLMDETGMQASKQQHHRHMRTCQKGVAGLTGCRLCLPFAASASTTPWQLVRLTEDELGKIDEEGCIYCSGAFDDSSENSLSESAKHQEEGGAVSSVVCDISATDSIDGSACFSDIVEGSKAEESTEEDPVTRPSVDINELVWEGATGNADSLTDDSFSSDGDDEAFRFFGDGTNPDIDSGKTKVYICTRDDDGKPKIAFRVAAVSRELSPDEYSVIDPLSREAKPPVIVWETARPILDTPLTEIDSSHSKQYIYDAFRDLLHGFEEFEASEEFWDDLSGLDCTNIRDLYEEVRVGLQTANGYVGTFNPTLSYCTGAHNNFVLLGSDQQAKGAVFYVCPYLQKEKTTMLHSVTILQSVLDHVAKHKSASPDTGIARDVQQILQRVMNQMNLHMEMSDYQIAAALIGIPSILCSDSYGYLNPDSYMGYRTHIQMHEDCVRREDYAFRMLNNEIDKEENKEDMKGFIAESDEEENDDEEEGDEDDEEEEEEDDDPNEPPSRPVYNTDDLKRDMGYLIRFNVDTGKDKRSLYIPKAALYANRGFELRGLNTIEYNALIRYGAKTSSTKRSKRFAFPASFEGAANYEQVLMKKHKTIIVIRKSPKHPGKEPDTKKGKTYDQWKIEADNYAKFYLTLFRPEFDCYSSAEQNLYSYDWAALRSFVNELMSDSSILSTFRLMSMHARMKFFFTSYETKVMLSRFRSRNRDEWDEDTKTALAQADRVRKWGESDHNKQIPEYDLTNCFLPLDGKENHALDLILNGTALLTSAYDRTAPDESRGRRQSVLNSSRRAITHEVACYRDAGDIQFFAQNLRSRKIESKDWSVRGAFRSKKEHFKKVREHRAWISKLKPRQREVYEVFRKYIRNPIDANRPPSITWINGCAGTGKSELIRRILVYSELKHRCTIRTAFNSINALLIGGHTTSSILHFNGKTDSKALYPLRFDEFKEFKSMVESATLILIDEFSNQAPWHLAKFSVECQRATGNYGAPFGGIPVIMGGDLGQMGPVKAGPSLAESIADMCMKVWTQR